MKQNIYDNPHFFEKYKDLRDQDKGINELLEQPVIKRLMTTVENKTILDLGCGLGQQIQSLLSQKPKQIIGVDISQKMIKEAQNRISSPKAQWICEAVEDYELGENRFDIILSSMTFHYVEDLKSLFRKIFNALHPGGQFLFSLEHPICTSILRSLNGEINEPGYAVEGSRKQDWFVSDVIKYHRKVSTIVENLLALGFVMKNLEEPVPDAKLLQRRPDFQKHIERPPVLILNVIKL